MREERRSTDVVGEANATAWPKLLTDIFILAVGAHRQISVDRARVYLRGASGGSVMLGGRGVRFRGGWSAQPGQ